MSLHKTQLIAEPGRHDYYIVREFDASIEMVFTTFVEPSLFVQWFMPAALGLYSEKMDCRTGGSYHLRYSGQRGTVFGFRGVYHEVLTNDLIIKTSEFEGLPQKLDPVLEKTVFEELDGNRCRVKIHCICPSSDYRDSMIAAGMQPTLDSTHDQLDELLMTIAVKQIS